MLLELLFRANAVDFYCKLFFYFDGVKLSKLELVLVTASLIYGYSVTGVALVVAMALLALYCTFTLSRATLLGLFFPERARDYS